MDEKQFDALTASMKKKLGDENFAIISDDIGAMLTGNQTNLKKISDSEAQITELKTKNEKLVEANGALLQQIPVGFEKKSEETNEKKRVNLSDAFDSSGHFKH